MSANNCREQHELPAADRVSNASLCLGVQGPHARGGYQLEGVLILADLRHLALAVQRPLKIKVKAQDGAGQKVSLSLSGWKARIFQHGEHCSCSRVTLPCVHAAECCDDNANSTWRHDRQLLPNAETAAVKLIPAFAVFAEYDHLDGVLFPDRVLADSFDSIKPELVRMEEEFVAANLDVDVQRV